MLSSLAAERARVADLDVKILDLERSLFALRTEKQLVLERLDSYQYPVLTLPNEIIVEIFVQFLPIYPRCPPLIGRDSPALLTQICRQWREIALGTPTLWRAISVSDPDTPFEQQVHLSHTWLSRSRGCPISFELDTTLPDFDVSHANEIASGIVARWEHLVLNQLSLPLLRAIEGPMRHLHRLELLLEDQDYAPGIKADFHEAPLLRTVLVDPAAVENTILPWAQLTSLALHGLFPRECVPILRQTVNLIHCELSLLSDDAHVPHITLPVLQSLTLTHTLANDSVTGYLQTLTVPAVRQFRVPESFLGPEPIDTLTSFISNSGCKLQELCVTGRKKGRTEGVSLRRSSKSSYRTAFLLATVSFAHWKISFADWVMSYNNF